MFFKRCMLCNLEFVPDCFKTQEMCNEAVCINPLLAFVPDYFKTEETCNRAVRNKPYTLKYVLNHLKTQEMCEGKCESNHAP